MLENCCRLQDKCTPALEDTIYESATLCKKDNMSETYEVCIHNPSVEMNNTKIHFYYERRCTSTRTRQSIGVAEYVKAIEMIIKGTLLK